MTTPNLPIVPSDRAQVVSEALAEDSAREAAGRRRRTYHTGKALGRVMSTRNHTDRIEFVLNRYADGEPAGEEVWAEAHKVISGELSYSELQAAHAESKKRFDALWNAIHDCNNDARREINHAFGHVAVLNDDLA